VGNEAKRWRCDKCGGVICVHKGYCLKCGPARRALKPDDVTGDSKMESLQQYMDEYKKQLGKGLVQKAYKGLMEYMAGLKTYFNNKYPGFSVSGSIYFGYMDMTYFPLFPESLKKRSLKIAVVFLHETGRFEAWLAGYNKKVQTEYLELFKVSRWNKYPLAPVAKSLDYVMTCTLADNPDFNDLDSLTKQIEKGTLAFIRDIEEFLAKH
jgi:hypothetical protein